jgi:type II secretory pathway pseudopilin PulG
LVELVMVTAIVAVIAAIAVPRYGSSVANMRVQMAARKLAADLAMIQSQARASSASRAIEFVPATGLYRLPQVGGIDGAAVYEVNLAADPYLCAFDLTFDGTGTINTLQFDGYGTPSRGVSVQLRSGTTQRTVLLSRTTGAVSITTP